MMKLSKLFSSLTAASLISVLAGASSVQAQSGPVFFRQAGTAPVYVMQNGSLHWIASGRLFNALGGQWNQVQVVSRLPYSVGAPVRFVKQSGAASVYVVENGQLRWIPSAALFFALGGQWNQMVTVPHLGQAPGAPITLIQVSGSPKVYHIQGSTEQWIPSAAAFNQAGYQWNQIVQVQRLPFPVSASQPTPQYPSLAQQVAQEPVASLSQIQADLNNPQALGELKWSGADALAVQKALGSLTASSATNAQYALTFLYASLANNASVFNSPISDTHDSTQYPWLPNVGFAPNNVSRVGAITTTSVVRPTGSAIGSAVYEYRVTYTTTTGQVLTQRFNTTLDSDIQPGYFTLNAAGWMGN